MARLAALDVQPAQRCAHLLEASMPGWGRRVVARSSMHNLLFTLPGDPYPFRAQAHVRADADLFEFRLLRGSHEVAADRCRAETAGPVLDAFLLQLVTE